MNPSGKPSKDGYMTESINTVQTASAPELWYWFNCEESGCLLLGARASSPARAEDDASQMPGKILRHEIFALRAQCGRGRPRSQKQSLVFEIDPLLELELPAK